METTYWFNTERFREVIQPAYQDGVAIEILSVEEFSPYQIDTGSEHTEDYSWIETAWEVRSRNTVIATGHVYEDTNIVVMPKPKMHLMKDAKRISGEL